MTFTEKFGSFVCEGDSLTCEADGFTVTARIVRDDCADSPDQRQDGFWPSLYKDAPGFIGPGNGWRERFDKAQARAEAVMEGWRKDEWFYCGIVLSVRFEGITLDDHAASLWGIEANYPDSDNAYLTEIACDLLPEALAAAKAAQARLCERLCKSEAETVA